MMSQNESSPNSQENKLVTGVVVSDKMEGTIIVEQQRLVKHERYGKYVKRRTRILADNPNNEARLDDIVIIERCRPLSKRKSWRLYKRTRIADKVEAADTGASPADTTAPQAPAAAGASE